MELYCNRFIDSHTEIGEIMTYLSAVIEEEKLSKNKVGERMGRNGYTVSRLLKCDNYPRLDVFLDMLHSLDMDIAIIYKGDNNGNYRHN